MSVPSTASTPTLVSCSGGRITPADRARIWPTGWPARSPTAEVHPAFEGCTGWRRVPKSLAHLSAGGQLQVANRPDMITTLEANLNRLRPEPVDAVGHLTPGRVLTARPRGGPPITRLALTCLRGGPTGPRLDRRQRQGDGEPRNH